jgi:hypothetical protein
LETNKPTRVLCGTSTQRWRNWPQTLVESVLCVVFRCSHKHLTRPITPRGPARSDVDRTYVVCLDCGTALSYSWEEMRVTRRRSVASHPRELASQDRTDAPHKSLA